MPNNFNSKLEVYVHRALIARGYVNFAVNVYPEWLINPSTSRRMQLDLYDPDRKFAIEVQGPTHHSDVDQMVRDVAKKMQCRRHGVKLMYVTDVNRYKDVKEIVSKLEEEEEGIVKASCVKC
jgi:hypothetical protein